MRRFEKGLTFYICHQLAGQPIYANQDLYKRAAELKRVKSKLKAMNSNPSNQKRKWAEQGAPMMSSNQT